MTNSLFKENLTSGLRCTVDNYFSSTYLGERGVDTGSTYY
jgi:hypothetical protein